MKDDERPEWCERNKNPGKIAKTLSVSASSKGQASIRSYALPVGHPRGERSTPVPYVPSSLRYWVGGGGRLCGGSQGAAPWTLTCFRAGTKLGGPLLDNCYESFQDQG